MNIRMLSLEHGARQATGTVIIIDVFRAFTVEAAGFSRGVKNFILTEDVDQAIAWREKGIGKYVIGEVGGEKPIEFDLPNSPRPFIDNETKFNGETLIHRSSSGTCGVCWAAPKADQIYAACFNNAEATVQTILENRPEVVSIVAMGAGGSKRTDEDELCAYYLRSRFENRKPDSQAICSLIRSGNTYHSYDHLIDAHYPGDTEIALQFDTSNFAIQVSWVGEFLISQPIYRTK